MTWPEPPSSTDHLESLAEDLANALDQADPLPAGIREAAAAAGRRFDGEGHTPVPSSLAEVVDDRQPGGLAAAREVRFTSGAAAIELTLVGAGPMVHLGVRASSPLAGPVVLHGAHGPLAVMAEQADGSFTATVPPRTAVSVRFATVHCDWVLT